MKTIVGLFDSRQYAESAVRDLEHAGFGRDQVSIVASGAQGTEAASSSATTTTRDSASDAAEGAGTGAIIGGMTGGAAGLIASLAGLAIPGIGPVLAAGPIVATLTGAGVGAVAGGLVGGLTSAGVPDDHARYYAEGVRRGGTLVTVSAADEQAERVMEIMNRHHPVDIEDRAATWRQTGFAAADTSAAGREASAPAGMRSTSAAAASTKSTSAPDQQRIPVVEEELKVGKQEVETGGGVRVKTRVHEQPVHEQVSLREEKVNVERRPVDRPATSADFDQAFKGGTIELTEKAEEAVVQKQARVVEEVVVNKEATERTETVRDTVRRTDVNIQPVEVGAGAAGEASGFENYESDFRSNFQASNPGAEYTFETAKPAYRYGYELAADRGRGGDWSSVESDAKTRWEQRNPGTWDKFKDAARYAYDRARSKVS